MKKFLFLLAVVMLLFTFSACGVPQSEVGQLEQQIEDMQSQLEQQRKRIEDLEFQAEFLRNLKNLDNEYEYDLTIIEGCIAFSFNSDYYARGKSMEIPDGGVINSDEGIEALANQSYDYAPDRTPYAEAAQFLREIKTEHLFDGYSFLLVNFLHSSSEKNIEFKSFKVENGILNVNFDIESPYCIDEDVITDPYVFCIKKIEGVFSYEITVNNLLLNNHEGGYNNGVRDLLYY